MLNDPDHLVTWSMHSNGFNNFIFLKQLLLKYIIKKKKMLIIFIINHEIDICRETVIVKTRL
jgi:hypothetical protein